MIHYYKISSFGLCKDHSFKEYFLGELTDTQKILERGLPKNKINFIFSDRQTGLTRWLLVSVLEAIVSTPKPQKIAVICGKNVMSKNLANIFFAKIVSQYGGYNCKQTKYAIKFANGSVVEFRSSREKLEGFSYDKIFIDDFLFWVGDDTKTDIDTLKECLTGNNNNMTITSTIEMHNLSSLFELNVFSRYKKIEHMCEMHNDYHLLDLAT